MQIIGPKQYQSTTWKNGSGITHEIAKKLTEDGFAWRLSLAEVSIDGPFSIFHGMSRILTVIEGAGIELHEPDRVLQAHLRKPVPFSGDTPIDSTCIDGPIRDFNVIFDPNLVQASVQVVDQNNAIDIIPNVGREFALFCLQENIWVAAKPIVTNGIALFHSPPTTIEFSPDGAGLLVTLDAIS